MRYTRREVGKLALAGLPAASLLTRTAGAAPVRRAKPDSKWAGVQVGMNVPYNFGNNSMSGDETLDRCVQLGISAVELRSQPIEMFLGSPQFAGGAAPARGGRGRGPLTPEQQAAQAAAAEDLRRWRLGASMTKARAFRTHWEDAGVLIQIVKFDWLSPLPADDILDYCFELAKTMGARAISTEMPINAMDDTKRLGQAADRHQIMVGYHGHTAVTPAIWEQAFGYAKYNGANLDLGHFVAGNNTSPIPFLKEHHDRITHMHVKDRKLNNGPNVPFGQGDTPIKEALQLLRDNQWNIQATIEFEYPIPPGSDRMTEIAKSIAYCKNCLVG
jgi:sugar phosphate isomerase/epimerase